MAFLQISCKTSLQNHHSSFQLRVDSRGKQVADDGSQIHSNLIHFTFIKSVKRQAHFAAFLRLRRSDLDNQVRIDSPIFTRRATVNKSTLRFAFDWRKNVILNRHLHRSFIWTICQRLYCLNTSLTETSLSQNNCGAVRLQTARDNLACTCTVAIDEHHQRQTFKG